MIKVVTFDFWNTIANWVNTYDWCKDQINETFTRNGIVGISDTRIMGAVTRAWQEWNDIWVTQQRTFGVDYWLESVLASLFVSLPETEVKTLAARLIQADVESHPPLMDGLAKVLPRLANKYRLAIISDTGISPGSQLRRVLSNHGVLQYFSHTTFSDEIGVSKPHPKAFLSTLEILNVAPEEAVHIGDAERTDIAGANRVGMHSILYLGAYQSPEDIQKYNSAFPIVSDEENARPDGTANNYAEVEEIIESL